MLKQMSKDVLPWHQEVFYSSIDEHPYNIFDWAIIADHNVLVSMIIIRYFIDCMHAPVLLIIWYNPNPYVSKRLLVVVPSFILLFCQRSSATPTCDLRATFSCYYLQTRGQTRESTGLHFSGSPSTQDHVCATHFARFFPHVFSGSRFT